MKKLILLFLFLASICFAKPTNIRLTLGHSDKLDLHGVPGTLYVEDPAVLDYEFHKPNWLIIKAKGVGQTKLYAIDESGKIDKSYVISVHYPVALLDNIIKNLFPKAKIKFRSIPKHLLAEGSAASYHQHQKILEQIYANVPKEQVVDKIEYPDIVMNEPSRQINLRVRIVEVRRVVSKALGINWDIKSSKKVDGNNLFTFKGPKKFSNYSNLNTNSSSGALSESSNTFSTFFKSDLLNVTGMIDLLESDNFATTVQEPNLTVKAGESASFSAGGSVPITRASDSTFVRGNVGYQDYGINLSYQADFDEDDPKLIKLLVTPSVSDVLPTTEPGQNPQLLRKQAQTVVELRSGQSIAIAGLVSSTTNSNRSGVPGLSTLPVIGDAFRSEDYSRLETEIVFIITPYIVHATQNGMIQDSMDNTGMPKSTILNSGFLVGDDDEE